LFVAVDPPAEQVEALAAAIGERDDALRWVPVHQWHLTLVFCGEVPEQMLPDLTARLARAAARSQPFSLRVQGAGTFPRQAARGRVLWMGLTGDLVPLKRLAERSAAAARRAGVAIEDRAYRPHLTLARARREAADMRGPLERVSSYEGPLWPVTTMRLVHSTLGREVRHEAVAEWRLGGSTDAD
jgi:2'-5' RNA ligase